MSYRRLPLLLILLLQLPSRARAQTDSGADSDADREFTQLITEAQGLLEGLQSSHRAGSPLRTEDAAKALQLAEQADARRSSARTLTFRGSAEQWLERWGAAEEHFSAALARTDDPYVTRSRAFVERSLDVVRSHMGEIVVTGPAGASVWVKDGYKARTRGVLPLATSLWVVPGPLSVQVTAAGYQPFQLPQTGERFSIKAGERKPITANPAKVTLVEIAPLGSEAAAKEDSTAGGSKWVGWTLLGIGAAAAGGGVIYALQGEGGCGSLPPTAICHTSKRPSWAGWAVAGAGASMAGYGGFLLLKSRDVEVSMAIGPGTFLVLGGRL